MANTEIPVKINIKTTIDEQETVELIVFGRFYQKENASFLQYKEVLEEGTVKTIIKLGINEMLILRSGAVKMRLPFQLEKEQRGSYELPFGVFETATLAKKMAYHFENKAGFIELLYDFSLQGEQAGSYHLQINFQEEKY
ncbi:DUF1934 domain-containing protein [Bacillus sp. JJ1764]|uniref:DUF1934 domain-containing protein n=1 Tax=Bacillus sp. JJ1764 TaxID=3122964 RepID=UPI002FFD83CB